MTPSDMAPVTLMIEMRERLVRIETKMDASTEKVDGHERRLNLLEADAAQLRTHLGVIKWAGGAFVTVATLFGDKLFHLVF